MHQNCACTYKNLAFSLSFGFNGNFKFLSYPSELLITVRFYIMKINAFSRRALKNIWAETWATLILNWVWLRLVKRPIQSMSQKFLIMQNNRAKRKKFTSMISKYKTLNITKLFENRTVTNTIYCIQRILTVKTCRFFQNCVF